jgi:hypothetical protein
MERRPPLDGCLMPTTQEFMQRLREMAELQKANREAFAAKVKESTDPISLSFRNEDLDLRRCAEGPEIELTVRRGSYDVGRVLIRKLPDAILRIEYIHIYSGLGGNHFGLKAIEELKKAAKEAGYRRICGEIEMDSATAIEGRRKFFKACGFQVDGLGNASLDL